MNKHFDDILAICLEKVMAEPGALEATIANYPQFADELRSMVETALWINNRAASLDPRPGFVTSSRKWVEEQVSKPVVAVPWYQRMFGQWKRQVVVPMLATLAVLVLFFTFTAGQRLATTAANALPGEPFYSVKIALENLQLAASLTDEGDARLYLEFADRRVNEIEQLIFEGDTDHIELAVARYEHLMQPAMQLTKAVVAADPERGAELSALAEATLSHQTTGLALIIEISPNQTLPAIERMVVLNESSLKTAQEMIILATLEPSGDPSVTKTVNTHVPPTHTVKPVNTQKPPTNTARPTNTSKPTQDEKSTNTPKPTNEPKLTNTPKPTQIAKPTSTPKPTDEPKPTKEDKPTSMPKPTDEPKPTNEPKPTQEDKPTKEPKP